MVFQSGGGYLLNAYAAKVTGARVLAHQANTASMMRASTVTISCHIFHGFVVTSLSQLSVRDAFPAVAFENVH